MAGRSQEAEFRAFVDAHRETLVHAAYMMVGDQCRAEEIVQATLADLYAHWPGSPVARAVALAGVLSARPDRVLTPWRRGQRVELVDRSSAPTSPPPPAIVADLAELDEDARRVMILDQLAGMSTSEIAATTGHAPARVPGLLQQALRRLAERDPARLSDDALTRELRSARPDSPAPEPGAEDDLTHGRFLVRRRRLRLAVGTAAALVVGVLGLTQVPPLPPPPDQASAASSPTPSASASPSCDVGRADCRVGLARAWRAKVAQAAISYVDPEHTYYSGFTFSDGPLYDSGGVWTGAGGVLGLDLSRLHQGATEVYVQIATSGDLAVPCGRRTRQHCIFQRFLDGNGFTLTETTDVTQGIEVQYSPTGDEVVTVIARNTSAGPQLPIDRAALLSLVQDPRLRLPPV